MTTPLLYAEEPVFDAVPSTQQLLRTKEIPWDIYMTARLISDHDLQLLRRYDKRDPDHRARLLAEAGPLYVAALLSVLKNVTKDETVQYALALFDDMLESNSSSAGLFHLVNDDAAGSANLESDRSTPPSSMDPYTILLRLLQRNDWFTQEKSALLLAAVLDARPNKSSKTLGQLLAEGGAQRDSVARTVTSFLDWLLAQLRRPSHPTRSLSTAVHCLSIVLREAPLRSLFLRAGGVSLLAPIVSMPAPGSQLNIQLLYEAIVCVWELSFYKPSIDALATDAVVGGLVDVVRLAQKEKLVRVALLALKNLLSLGGDHPALEFAVVEKGLPRAITTRQEQSWDDEDVPGLLEWMETHLEEGVLALSSLERYKKEVMSGTLSRSPLHDSEAFWLENAERLTDNNSALLRALLLMIENARDPVTLAVACKDVGQFVSYFSHGRGIITDLKGKELVMRLMVHPDGEVQREALICVQRLLLSRDKLEFMAA